MIKLRIITVDRVMIDNVKEAWKIIIYKKLIFEKNENIFGV